MGSTGHWAIGNVQLTRLFQMNSVCKVKFAIIDFAIAMSAIKRVPLLPTKVGEKSWWNVEGKAARSPDKSTFNHWSLLSY